MIYIVLFLIGIVSALIVNFTMDFKKCPDTNKFMWILGYTYKKIQYVIIMILTPLVFLLIYYKSQTNHEALKYCILFILLAAASIKDFNEKQIPNILIIVGLALGLAVSALSFNFGNFLDSIIAFIIVGIILLLISLATKGGVGMGDVKLVAVCCLFTGLSRIISVMFYSLLLTAIAGVIIIIVKKANLKTKIPFAPFLAMGFVLSLLLM